MQLARREWNESGRRWKCNQSQRNNQLEEDDKRVIEEVYIEEFQKRSGREATKKSREES